MSIEKLSGSDNKMQIISNSIFGKMQQGKNKFKEGIELLHSTRKKFFSMKFIRYALVGGGSMLFTLGVTYALTETQGWNYLIPYMFSLALVTISNFLLAMKFIFKVQTNYLSRFSRYIIVYILNVILVQIIESQLKVHYTIAIIGVTVLLFLLKFLIYDHFVFHNKEKATLK